MADLRSEIEARKSRIAELKRQREALAHANTAPVSHRPIPSQKLSVAVLPGPQVEIEAPFLYTRQIQTDSLEVKEAESTKTEHSGSDEATAPAAEAPPPEAEIEPSEPEFKLAETPNFPPSLIAFLEDSWRAVSRSSQGAPAVRDYTSLSGSKIDKFANGSLLQKIYELEQASSLLVWSPHFPDLFITRSMDARRALVWSVQALDHPEFSLRSPTPITNLVFSPHNANFVYAGGANGQILAWDLGNRTRTAGARLDLLPRLRSPIENAGIIKLLFVGSNLVSLNEDGYLHVWSGDQLSRPRHTILIDDRFRSVLPALKITSAIAPTAMAICASGDSGYALGYGTGICVLGSIQGQLFRLPALPSSPPKPFASWRHAAPVSSLEFRTLPIPPSEDPKRQGTVLASGGFDWKIRIWFVPHAESETPVPLVELKIDYSVTSICWHPTVPSVLAAVGESQIQIWNLDHSTVKPVLNMSLDDHDDTGGNGGNSGGSGGGGSGSSSSNSSHHHLTEVRFCKLGLSVATERGGASLYALSETDAALQGTDSWLLERTQYKNI